MARYDLYSIGQNSFVIDVQADLIDGLKTRAVVPLMPVASAPPVLLRLNPQFEIDGQTYVFVAQYIATLPLKILGNPVKNLKNQADDIRVALDMLFQGF